MEWFLRKPSARLSAIAAIIGTFEQPNPRQDATVHPTEALYRSIVSTAPDGFWLVDAQQGRLLEVNEAYCQLSGYSRAELLDMSIADLEARETPEEIAAHIQHVIAVGFDRFETRHRCKDGSLLDVEISARYLPLRGGLFVCFTRDITARRQAEEQLRRREEEFRLVFEYSNDAVFWADAATGLIINCNHKAEALTGRTRAELIGMHQSGLHPPETVGLYAALFKQAVIQSQFQPIEAEIYSRSGKRTPVLISTSVIAIGDRTIIQGVFHDITERKRVEEERLEMERRLLHAQRLESLGIMAGGVAHDFNNLLMIILGNLDLAVTALPPNSATRSNIEQAIHAVQQAADLTQQMLAYCGKGRFIVKTIDLNALIQENLNLFEAAIPETIHFDLRLDRDIPAIKADAGQMQQVIMNLITNAAESIGEQRGVITLATGVERCDAARLLQSRLEEKPPAGEFVYVQVTDTGCGMDEETSRRLFDPFFTTKFTGRGLGLSAVLGIVRGHGGAILLDSALDRGTTVTVLFPVAIPEST